MKTLLELFNEPENNLRLSNAFYNKAKELVYRKLYTFKNNMFVLEEAFSQTTLKLCEKKMNVCNNSHFENTIVQMTRNHCIDILRKQKNCCSVMLQDDITDEEDNYFTFEPSSDDNPESLFLRKELKEKVEETLARMPEREALALKSKYILGNDGQQTAILLNMPYSQVASFIKRSKEKFIRLYKGAAK